MEFTSLLAEAGVIPPLVPTLLSTEYALLAWLLTERHLCQLSHWAHKDSLKVVYTPLLTAQDPAPLSKPRNFW